MWPESFSDATRETGLPVARTYTNIDLPDYPDREVIDYYLAKASAMRARSFRRTFSRGWRAIHRFLRRQVSPCRRVKLPQTAA